jgi:hypothetical protein
MRHEPVTAAFLLFLTSLGAADWPPLPAVATLRTPNVAPSPPPQWQPRDGTPAGVQQPAVQLPPTVVVVPAVVTTTPGIPNKRAPREEVLVPPVAFLDNPVSGPLPQVSVPDTDIFGKIRAF